MADMRGIQPPSPLQVFLVLNYISRFFSDRIESIQHGFFLQSTLAILSQGLFFASPRCQRVLITLRNSGVVSPLSAFIVYYNVSLAVRLVCRLCCLVSYPDATFVTDCSPHLRKLK